MKKVYLIVIALVASTQVKAQINDVDARVQYQKAEDAYNSGNYLDVYSKNIAA
jgi:hypothetical protein